MNRLVCTDIDRTLIASGTEIASPQVASAARDWYAGENKIVPVTSRTAAMMEPLRAQLGLRDMGVLDGGATLYDFGRRKMDDKLSRWLGVTTTRQAVKAIAPYCEEVYYGEDSQLYTPGALITEPSPSIFAVYSNVNEQEIADRLAGIRGIEQPPRTNSYEGSSTDSCVQIVQPGVNKGSGVTALLADPRYSSIDPSNMMAAGDGEPDLDLFRAMPEGTWKVAIGEGNPKLCMVADEVFPPADKDGFAIALREFQARI